MMKRNSIDSSYSFTKYGCIALGSFALATVQSQAEIVTINLASAGSNSQNITGVNPETTVLNPAGANSGTWRLFGTGSDLGMFSSGGMKFAINGGNASPKNFAGGSLIISNSSTFSQIPAQTFFKNGSSSSANFEANSYLGFQFTRDDGATFNYGYIEATWNSTSNQFQFLSAAYENTAGVGITAGAAVPEPGTLTLGSLALLAGGGAAVRRYRKQRQSPSASTTNATDPVTPVA